MEATVTKQALNVIKNVRVMYLTYMYKPEETNVKIINNRENKKPKREITKITNSQKTNRTYG